MRYAIFTMLFFVSVILHAQTLEEANTLYADKKYMAAAEIYEQLYRFDKAAESYKMQISILEKTAKTNKKNTKQPVVNTNSLKLRLKRAENLARMISRCENIRIIDSIIVDRVYFLNAYRLSEEAGTLEKTKNSVLYENQLKNRRFYGKIAEKNLYRLYTQVKIQTEWSEEKPLDIPFDSLENDNYPFIMSDGLTIYYASTGNESIGGYDLFVSRYNMDNDTYLAPKQLGMPFNSTCNDYMMAIDELTGVGYFATDRFQPEDKVIIYTFIPNEEPVFVESEDFAVLSGRAGISSIRDTWRQGENYEALLQKIKNDIAKGRQQEAPKDFTFVINDNIIYYTLSDFNDDGAKQSFLHSQELQQQIFALENQLDVQRRNYAEGDAGRKHTLKLPILENESRLDGLYNEYKKAEIDARNREVRKLRIEN
ncbi:MAG: tetratricopeptide repeat protein [Dysgonamonadaceae bacterium]|nr:tetratricopeptide repeat protein [Dysgonamonadaceae bacterium]